MICNDTPVVIKETRRIKYSCDLCIFQCDNEKTLKEHITDGHEVMKFSCKECSTETYSISDLKLHVRIKHRLKHESIVANDFDDFDQGSDPLSNDHEDFDNSLFYNHEKETSVETSVVAIKEECISHSVEIKEEIVDDFDE